MIKIETIKIEKEIEVKEIEEDYVHLLKRIDTMKKKSKELEELAKKHNLTFVKTQEELNKKY